MQEQLTNRCIQEEEIVSLLARPPRAWQEVLENGHHFFAQLDGGCLARIKATAPETSYAKGTILFAEERKPDGVYVILEGRAKLSMNSAHGKSLILGFFGPGSVLGLEGAILGWPCAATAEIVTTTKAAFMTCNDLQRHLRSNDKVAFEAAEMLSEVCYFLLSRIKAIELSESAEEKLARFLLGMRPEDRSSRRETRLKIDLSQEVIAQMIGVSRETVTRSLSRLKKRHILDWGRQTLVIRDRHALEKIAEAANSDAHRGGTSKRRRAGGGAS